MRPEIVGFKGEFPKGGDSQRKRGRGLRTKSRVLINKKDCSIGLQTSNLPSLQVKSLEVMG